MSSTLVEAHPAQRRSRTRSLPQTRAAKRGRHRNSKGHDRMSDHHDDTAFDDDEPLPQRMEAPVPAEPEQIGTLIYVPNAEYPYPFEVEQPPHFWMEETTGVLSEAVDAYMNGEKLSN